MEGLKLWSNYSYYELGNGRDIKVWKDTWAAFDNPLANQLHTPLSLEMESLTVDSIIKDGHWDISQLGYPLPHSIASTILATFIRNKWGLKDKLKCSLVVSGEFSTKLAYQNLLKMSILQICGIF